MNFEAEVRQVKTMVDGSVNVTLNLPEYHVKEAQELMAMIGELVTCSVIAGNNQYATLETRTNRKPKRTA